MESKRLRVLALAGMLAAVGYVLQLFEFPLLPAASFLKFDFGDVAVFVAGSAMGPAAAILTAVVKGMLWALIGRGADGWVGAGMNTVTVIAFALPVAFLARSRKTLGQGRRRRYWAFVVMTVVMAGVNLSWTPGTSRCRSRLSRPSCHRDHPLQPAPRSHQRDRVGGHHAGASADGHLPDDPLAGLSGAMPDGQRRSRCSCLTGR